MAVTFQYRTKSGAVFEVTPKLVAAIDDLTFKLYATISDAKKAGKYLGYLSVPISARGGGHRGTNVDMAAKIADRVVHTFGNQLWLLNPAAYDLPSGATGSDYMAVWSDILAGIDGTGQDFDLVYFVGPHDVWHYFGVGGSDRLGTIEKWVRDRSAKHPEYAKIVADPKLLRSFVRYYGLRGSAAYSKGAHDEWNIVSRLNSLREIGDSIAVYFDGLPIEPGDFDDEATPGTELRILHGD
jgi:hypothetical protein